MPGQEKRKVNQIVLLILLFGFLFCCDMPRYKIYYNGQMVCSFWAYPYNCLPEYNTIILRTIDSVFISKFGSRYHRHRIFRFEWSDECPENGEKRDKPGMQTTVRQNRPGGFQREKEPV